MAAPLENLRALVRPLWRRLALIVAHGTLRLSNDATKLQRLQVDFLQGETRGELQRFGEFGLSSRPPNGAEVIALFQAGDRAHGVIVAVEDGRYRPKDLEEGETALYNAFEVLILLRKDGSISIKAQGGVSIDAPNVELQGSLTVHGSISAEGSISSEDEVSDANGAMQAIRQGYDIHTHGGVQGGSGTTAPPLPQL